MQVWKDFYGYSLLAPEGKIVGVSYSAWGTTSWKAFLSLNILRPAFDSVRNAGIPGEKNGGHSKAPAIRGVLHNGASTPLQTGRTEQAG